MLHIKHTCPVASKKLFDLIQITSQRSPQKDIISDGHVRPSVCVSVSICSQHCALVAVLLSAQSEVFLLLMHTSAQPLTGADSMKREAGEINTYVMRGKGGRQMACQFVFVKGCAWVALTYRSIMVPLLKSFRGAYSRHRTFPPARSLHGGTRLASCSIFFIIENCLVREDFKSPRLSSWGKSHAISAKICNPEYDRCART